MTRQYQKVTPENIRRWWLLDQQYGGDVRKIAEATGYHTVSVRRWVKLARVMFAAMGPETGTVPNE